MSDLEIAEMHVGLANVKESPLDAGTIEMIAVRPDVDQREVVPAARIEPGRGVVGDSWSARRHPSTEAEVTLMNARCIALLAGTVDRWPLAGDQLYVDLDLSTANLPPGTRLDVGSATIEITDQPHTGCGKFVRRFGVDAMRFVNTPLGRESFFDDRTVRRIAMMHGVPCITTLTGAAAAVNAIRAMHTEGLTVRALQEYHAETATRKA